MRVCLNSIEFEFLTLFLPPFLFSIAVFHCWIIVPIDFTYHIVAWSCVEYNRRRYSSNTVSTLSAVLYSILLHLLTNVPNFYHSSSLARFGRTCDFAILGVANSQQLYISTFQHFNSIIELTHFNHIFAYMLWRHFKRNFSWDSFLHIWTFLQVADALLVLHFAYSLLHAHCSILTHCFQGERKSQPNWYLT